LDAETMPFMDTTGAATLQAVMDELAEQGVTVAVANAKGPVRTMLERAGLARATGEVSVFPSLAAAVAKLSQNEQTPEHNPGRQGGRDAVRF
jgi:MFS superfamily sulfate permease-like transporter